MVDDQQVARFLELTHATPEQAIFYLEASGENFDRALQMFHEQHHSAAIFHPRPHPPDVPPRPRAPAVRHRAQAGAPGLSQPLGAVLALPLTVINTGFSLVFRLLSFGVSIGAVVARQILPQPVSRALAGAGRALRAGSVELDPTFSAQAFARHWQHQYCVRQPGIVLGMEEEEAEVGVAGGPQWQECGWQEATNRATAEGKFLLVYLHSSQHQDTDGFCRGTLCNPEFDEYVNNTFLCWGGDLRYSDALRLSNSLGAAAYPYIALLAFSGARTRLVTCFEGRATPSQLLTLLQSAVEDNQHMMWQEQAEREQRELDRRLREEQDAEFQRSLEEDRERERAREQERQAQEMAEQAQKEVEERERAEKDEQERRRAETEQALQRRKEKKAASLPEEPAAGTPGTTLLRIRLPDGNNHQRRFKGDDTMQVVYDYVDSLSTVTALKYSLATAFPRRVYGADTLQQPLASLDLVPQAVLLVQPEDD